MGTSDLDILTPEEQRPLDVALARQREIRAERQEILNPLQLGFINHYFDVQFDLPLAAQRAGIPLKQARAWIETEGHPVAEHIGRRLEAICKQTDISMEHLIELLYAEATRMPDGKEDFTVSHAARISALDKLVKIRGGYEKTGGGGAKVSVNIQINSDEANVELKGDENE